MKKTFSTLVFALVAFVAVQAQQISVVATNGATTLYRTLADAINGAQPGSVIYLPGGGFTIADDVKITKKLTIIGIGHYVKGDNVNADGNTTIGGNLWFNEGSSGSAVMGCYITGAVVIGEDGTAVSDVLIRYCNLNQVQVRNVNCMETIVNQNYIRWYSYFSGSNAEVTNNVLHSISNLDDGKIACNVILSITPNQYNYDTPQTGWASDNGPFYICDRTQITNNVIVSLGESSYSWDASNSLSGNVSLDTDKYGEKLTSASGWAGVFKNWNNGAISPDSNFHFSSDYAGYETKCGIYAGTGFKDEQMAPVPYITYKSVDQETDAQGKLHVKIRVSANR